MSAKLVDFLLPISYNNKKGGEKVKRTISSFFVVSLLAVLMLFFGIFGTCFFEKHEMVANADSNTYTITFDTSDWEGVSKITLFDGTTFVEKTSTEAISYEYVDGDVPQKIWLYTLTKDGYDFSGWYASTLETAKYDREVGAYYVDSNLKKDIILKFLGKNKKK